MNDFKILESIERHSYMLELVRSEQNSAKRLAQYNNRLVISECVAFLEAIRNDMGGEILNDAEIGTYLYFGEEIAHG